MDKEQTRASLNELSYCCGSARQNARLFATIATAARGETGTLALWPGDPVAEAHRLLAEVTAASAARMCELEGVHSRLLSMAVQLDIEAKPEDHPEDVLDEIEKAVTRMREHCQDCLA